MSYDRWLLFTSIAFAATITPGPAILLVSSHSVAFGARPSMATMAGNVTGLFIMSLLSVLGLSAVILHSAPVFLAVKLLGAGYLVFLGVKLWRKGFGPSAAGILGAGRKATRPSLLRLYGNGLLVALGNPKAIAFTTALFPQFIQPDRPITGQFGILILTFMVLSFTCLLAYALAAERTRRRPAPGRHSTLLSRAFGGLFIGSGIVLATTSRT